MSIEALRAEFTKVGIGPEMFERLQALCRQAARRYPPSIYAPGSDRWSDDAFDDLVQEVVTRRLLGERQLDYIMKTAATLGDFERLVILQVRRTLGRRRERTVVDNLLDRCAPILRAVPFETVGSNPERFRLADSGAEARDSTPDELRDAALAARAVPRIPAAGSERLPAVYGADALEALLLGVAAALPCAFSHRDLDEILRLVLTGLLNPDLEVIEDTNTASDQADLSPDQAAVVEETISEIMAALTAEQASILQMKAANVSDAEAAAALGVSRPTLADRKQQAFELIRRGTVDLSESQRDAATTQLLNRIVANGRERPDA